MQALSDTHGVGPSVQRTKELLDSRVRDKSGESQINESESSNINNDNNNCNNSSNNNNNNNVNDDDNPSESGVDSGCDITPLYSGFARTSQELERISDFIASTAWDGDLSVARGKRLELCRLMDVEMQTRVANDIG